MSTTGEQLIQFSEKAKAQVPLLQKSNPEWSEKAIRIYLSGKGCDGFDYGVCFDNVESSDQVVKFDGFEVAIDPDTLQFVEGSVIDWVDDERGQGFLVENPNHKKFRGKFFKKKEWKEKLVSRDVH